MSSGKSHAMLKAVMVEAAEACFNDLGKSTMTERRRGLEGLGGRGTEGLEGAGEESGQIEGGMVTSESGGASQEVRCLMCDARWVDNYDLTGYGDLRVDGLPVEVEEQAD